ncbi:MOSC domain-containing protein [Actinokineospora bangkokensis]|uniref:MOSC domain-containing protein n=1 Tax=Actinokineospora bangkokensis TaxID=1193682 RepID=UPI000A84E7ED|nr:MOSC domain-containing protein [Actinokineospora bangkokensis]
MRDAAGKFGSGKNTRRFRLMPGLLRLGSRYPHGLGQPQLLAPDGWPVADSDAYLRAHLRRDDVELVPEGEVSHFDQLPVSVLTTATLDWVQQSLPGVPVDERRFRPNIVVRTPPGTAPFVEDNWLGRTAVIGEGTRIEFVRSSERCVMVNEAQADLPQSSLVLKTISAAHDNRLDALARVLIPGNIALGDPVVFA